MEHRRSCPNTTALIGEKLLTEREAAEMLAVSPTTLSTWRSRHRYALRFVRLGGARSIRYRLSDVQRFIENGLVEQPHDEAV